MMKCNQLFGMIFVTATLVGVSGEALGNPRVCGQRQAIVAQLKAKYGETAQSRGFAQGAGMVEIYANSTSGSWTIVLTHPTGMSCLMASGEAFEAIPERVSDAPA